MSTVESRKREQPIGQAWLARELDLRAPRPATESFVVSGARRTETHRSRVTEFYPLRYATEDSAVSHLRFALRHEPLDLGVLAATFKAIGSAEVEAWVRAEPTGGFSRRAWFLYETLTGRTLDLDDAQSGNYRDALDPARHFVAQRRNSRRHRVADNLLGTAGICPTVRRTPSLDEYMSVGLNDEAGRLMQDYSNVVLERAVNYLYTKETRSSFAIEGETPNAPRTQKFVAALRTAHDFDPTDKAALIKLQGMVVDRRFAATDWRAVQNYVGSTIGGYRERVDYVCPRPEDVQSLMEAWMALTRRVVEGGLDPVVAAAVSAMAFVLIHPFEDGNGRIHRFIVHNVLAKLEYGPSGVIFPVSAAMLRDRQGYYDVLESISKTILPFVRWRLTPQRNMVVENDTADLYRYFDATVFAEYLYECVAATVRHDLTDELGFVRTFDTAFRDVQEIADMPDRQVSLFVRLCMQNGGRLSKAKRDQFAVLENDEIEAMERAVREAMED